MKRKKVAEGKKKVDRAEEKRLEKGARKEVESNNIEKNECRKT